MDAGLPTPAVIAGWVGPTCSEGCVLADPPRALLGMTGDEARIRPQGLQQPLFRLWPRLLGPTL
jgi:hypothetical protein